MQKVIGEQLVNYEVFGDWNKKDLLILHGWGGSLEEWREIAQRLSQKYCVWSLDFPGFGGSPKPTSNWGVYEYADLVRDFLINFRIKKPIIIGHSFGGRVAILLDAGRLILVDAAGLKIKTLKAKISGFVSDYLKWVPQNVKNIFGSPDYKSAGSMRKIFVKTVNQDLSDEMTEIDCPAVIIWGEKDLVLPVSQAKKVKSLIKDSVLRIVWGADHWPHLSKTKEFMDVLGEEGV